MAKTDIPVPPLQCFEDFKVEEEDKIHLYTESIIKDFKANKRESLIKERSESLGLN